MTTALYPASFDPITYGHIDIARRAARLFDRVVLGVYDKPSKNLLFSSEERRRMVATALSDVENVDVRLYAGITVVYAREIGAAVMVRGLRTVGDFEAEQQLALGNKSLAADIETVCLMTNQAYSFVSSSLVKDIALNGGQVDHMVPPHVVEALAEKYKQR